jgi:hypothetical protein
MTERQQKRFYFPAWNECVLANQWRMEKKRLIIPEDRLTAEGRQVVDFALQRAAAEHRGPTLDDLRHAAHIVAFGRDKSSTSLTNAETDKIVTLFRLLTDPENLDAVIAWAAYLRGEDPGSVKRVEWFITNAAPDAYVRQIAADRFGTRQWENLNLGQKRSLAMTLSNRKAYDARPLPAPAPVPAGGMADDHDNADPDWSVP